MERGKLHILIVFFNMWFLDALEEEIPEKDFDFIDNDPISLLKI